MRTPPDHPAKSPTEPDRSSSVDASPIHGTQEKSATPALESLSRAFTEVLPLSMDKTVTLFQKRNYKVCLTIGIQPSVMRPVIGILDTGAGPNLVAKDFLPSEWQQRIKPIRDPGLVAATKEAMVLQEMILLCVRLGDLEVRAWFGVVDRLAVRLLLGTSFIDRFVKAIFPQDKCLLPMQSKPVAIIDEVTKAVDVGAVEKKLSDEGDETGKNHTIWVAQGRHIAPMTTSKVLVNSTAPGRSYIVTHPRLTNRRMSLVAQGLMDITARRPFYVLVSNFGRTSIHLPKHMSIAIAESPPDVVIQLGPQPQGQAKDIGESSTQGLDIVAPVHYKPTESRTSQITRHTEVANEDAKRQREDWREHVEVGAAYEYLRPEINSLLTEFTSMWDGHLGTIQTVKHRIDLDPPKAKPIHSAPYRAGPAARQLEREEIDKMLRMGVIEPAQTEWASPIVFVPKKTGHSGSALTIDA